MPPSPSRARPLDPEERRARIIEAVTPLLLEQGSAVTSRQLAEAAGVAEGTVFRAFGDKESLFDAVIEAHRDPAELRRALEAIAGADDADATIARILELLIGRLTVLVQLSIALHRHGGPRSGEDHERHRDEFEARSRKLADQLEALLAPHADRLAVAPAMAAGYLRMVATAAALPQLHPGGEITVPQLVSIVREGVVRR